MSWKEHAEALFMIAGILIASMLSYGWGVASTYANRDAQVQSCVSQSFNARCCQCSQAELNRCGR